MENNSHKIVISQFPKEGELQKTYSALHNYVTENSIGDFVTNEISYNLKNFVDIETQLSYDDSINLILNNNEEVPRIINTQFRVLGNNRYEYLTRNQNVATNLYREGHIDSTTDLFLRSNNWPIIDLVNVTETGQLMGGNYTFYIRYCDEDYNETEVVSESGIVSIFKGSNPSTISGTILDERTNKTINLHIDNIDSSFNKFYLYFSRDTSDLNGISLTKYYKVSEPFIVPENGVISITGYENVEEISRDTLFINYNYFTAAKTHAVTQNMLFLGNVKTSEKDYPALQQVSYKIAVTLKQKETSIGYITSDYGSNWDLTNEYYNPKNIYYYLGYWPEEYYSLGICYILKDGTVTNSFALLGSELELNTTFNLDVDSDKKYEVNKIINEDGFINTGGIFKLPKVDIIDHINHTVNPLYFEFKFPESTLKELKNLGVEGYFFTRTKRLPISLFQGLSVGIDKESGIPMPFISSGVKTDYIAESFVDEDDRKLSDNVDKHLRESTMASTTTSALLSLDPMVVPQLHGMLSWNEYNLQEEYKCSVENSSGIRKLNITSYEPTINTNINSSLVYIEKDIPSFYINNHYFSTRAGNAESARELSFLDNRDSTKEADNLLRGIYCPIIGCNKYLNPSSIFTVKNKVDDNGWKQTLLNNNNSYFAITNRYKLEDTNSETLIAAYRGDCFTNTVTIRINRNFIDPTFPANDDIVDPETWSKNYKGLNKMSDKDSDKIESDDIGSWTNINLGDINTVPLGLWITFKCLSNYNLGLRSLDYSDVGLIGKLGSPSSFYPLSGIDARSKMPESQLLNEGYSITLPRKSYSKWIPTPYENWNFENRIAFSNIASTKMFTNGFRVFQGLAYQDVDKQFGQIVKLFPYAQNLLCVFEHGLAIVPINEKALLSTQEGLSIHLYGAGVLQEQVSVISPDYGSTWMESLIKTPDAYYGVDTSAKKIWKFNNTEGFQCISDFKIQSFLNDNLNIDWDDKFFMGATNVRTHYNNFKGDVIFTFYNENDAYSLCYNERMKMWVSRYTWMPLLSANIDNQFYSFNRSVIEKYTKLYKQTTKESGIICIDPLLHRNVNTSKYLPIKFKYSGLLENNIVLKLNKLIIDNVEHYPVENANPIIIGNNICGIYYQNGIDDLFNIGGAITNQESDYSNMPIYKSRNTGWLQIVNHSENDEFVEINDVILSKCTISKNNNLTSSIPVIYWSTPDEDNIIEYVDNRIYPTYLIKNENYYEFHIPEVVVRDHDVQVIIEAQQDNSLIETYSVNIGHEENYKQSLSLYKHDINSNTRYWYDAPHPFEYEFVVNQPAGFHKIFNNLMIISNNVEPESLEVEIVGDSYDFKEEFINQTDENIRYKFPIITLPGNKIYQTKLTLDKVTNENRLLMYQDCLNIKDFGRRLGNISYIEGKWYVVLQPIYYEDKTLKTTRLRDKWAKIRIKYSGEKLAIITAIQTLMNISYV